MFLTRRPIAAAGSFQYSRARFSLSTTTVGRSKLSAQVSAPPGDDRLPIVLKYPASTILYLRIGGMRPPGPGKSSTKIGSCSPDPSIATDDVRPTEVTPGTCSSRCTICS